MRIGIIGLGSIGKRHAANASEMGHVVVGCDPREVDIPITQVRTVDTLVVFQPDALMICTPANTHAHIARELRDLGYAGPLFCEKPLALSVEECAIFREWPHPTTMVGYNLRFHPDVWWMRDSVPKPEEVICHVMWDGGKYGNALLESSHEIDLALWLGREQLTYADAVGDTIVVGFGERSFVEVNANNAEYCRRWSVADAKRGVSVYFDKPEQLGHEMYRDELGHFLVCVAEGLSTNVPFADGIRVVQVCEEAMKMAGVST